MNNYEEAIARFSEEYKSASVSGLPEPTAVTLATANADGRPSIRTVLLKSFDANGFVFFTNLKSRKGEDLAQNPKAALCFYWGVLQKQVIVEGLTSPVSDQEADEYWATRPRDSQIGAWASLQSQAMSGRAEFLGRIAKVAAQYLTRPVPRPPHWSGIRIQPTRIEFWKGMPFRLHERTLYEKTQDSWKKLILYP